MNHIKTELDRKMEEFNNMKQEMIDELESKIKLNREKHCYHCYIEVFKKIFQNFGICILKTFWFGYRLECKFIEG